jgi:hypothetical protein
MGGVPVLIRYDRSAEVFKQSSDQPTDLFGDFASYYMPGRSRSNGIIERLFDYVQRASSTRWTPAACPSSTTLPQGLGQGTLLGSNQLFVWESFDPMGLAVYKSGQWESLPPNLLDSRPIVERCASRQELWVLNGDFGPASLTGSDNAVPNPSPRFFLYRLPLKESDPGWESVPVLGLEESSFAELACSETEAFVRVDSSLFFTRRPRTPIAEAEGLEHLRGNPALRPVVFLQDFESCAVVMPGGRIQRTNRGRPGTATSPTTSVCDAVPWPIDRGHSAISLGVRGMLQEQPW